MLKILLIEDNPFFYGIWNSIIGRATNSPYKLDIAINDFIAIEMIGKTNYDIIISDIILSGRKTGFDIWKDIDTQNCIFVFASSVPIEKFAELTAKVEKKHDGFIQKPLNLNHCVNFLSQVILKEQRLKSS